MSMSDPRYLKTFLEEAGLKAKKSLSQNFLVDRKVLAAIVKASGVAPGGEVLEIGPGPGALTESLLAQGIRVTAVELDRGFAAALRQRVEPRLTVIEGDALQVPLESLAERARVVVGNLPYAITTPLLGRFLPRFDLFDRVVVMVQKEVAERMCAPPGNKTFGLLSLFIQLHARPTWICSVSAKAFRPVPKVDSAVVSMQLMRPVEETQKALSLARVAFQQRRKMIRSTLSQILPQEWLQDAFFEAGIAPEARPETLGPQQWCSLARASIRRGHEHPKPADESQE
jgi:16S rRNA (adenine1518-N6/adenine1519-N6)-dimethyltransferase